MRFIHKKRLLIILFLIVALGSASALIFSSLNSNLLYFYTPSQLLEKHISAHQKIRLGGLVKEGSLIKSKTDLKVEFEITDLKQTIKVKYDGILPDLFREKRGVIVRGRLINRIFIAESVLAKHDEKYMPVEVAKSLGYMKSKK